MNILGDCPIELGWAQIALDYRTVTRTHGAPIVQGCLECNVAHWPPRLRCSCGSADLHWVPAGKTGRLISTVGVNLHPEQAAKHSVPRRLAQRLPYTTVFVELDEWAGVRMAALGEGLALTHAQTGSLLELSVDLTDDSVFLLARTRA